MAETHIDPREHDIHGFLARGDRDAALALTIQVYGPEILAFLKARLRNLEHAREVFAWVAEDVWRGLLGFRGESGLRTWLYAVARRAAARYVDRELRVRKRAMPLSEISRASALAVAVTTESRHSDRVERLRAQLDDDERTLLSLRVDKEMDWREIALIMLFEESQPDEATVTREAARLRKRFQLLKDKLRRLAQNPI